MKNVSFLHCADIHLGHKQYNEPQRLLDFAQGFKQVVCYAKDEKVDFVLISGDFFHKRSINADTLTQAVELLEPLKEANIPVIAIEGNHDKALYQDKGSWLEFLNKQGYICLLSPIFAEGKLVMQPWDEKERYGSRIDLCGVRVYGVGYLGVTTGSRLEEVCAFLQEEAAGERQDFVVFMLHAAVNRLMGQDLGGVRKEELAPFREMVDYFALGHIHSRYEIDDWIYNPGSLECVHLDEYHPELEKGFYHVIIDGEGKSVRYIRSIHRPVALYDVNVEGFAGQGAVRAGMMKELDNRPPVSGSQVQIKLKGEIAFNPIQLDTGTLAEEVKEKCNALYVEVLNHTDTPGGRAIEVNSFARRAEIEKIALKQLLNDERVWETGDLETAVSIVQKIKEMSLAEEEDAELFELLLKHAGLAKDEAEKPVAEKAGESS